MRCQACDSNLTDFESTTRSDTSGDYLDMCSRCLSFIRGVLRTSENFLLYDPELDDLDTQFDGRDDVALGELIGAFEDDSLAGVNSDGERIADGGKRDET